MTTLSNNTDRPFPIIPLLFMLTGAVLLFFLFGRFLRRCEHLVHQTFMPLQGNPTGTSVISKPSALPGDIILQELSTTRDFRPFITKYYPEHQFWNLDRMDYLVRVAEFKVQLSSDMGSRQRIADRRKQLVFLLEALIGAFMLSMETAVPFPMVRLFTSNHFNERLPVHAVLCIYAVALLAYNLKLLHVENQALNQLQTLFNWADDCYNSELDHEARRRAFEQTPDVIATIIQELQAQIAVPTSRAPTRIATRFDPQRSG